jgi:predicted short-subunit dehydrogenase-like oxidoreductase (DUF2520 family)
VETGSEHPARLRVGIIGPGRVGTALGRALAAAGHRVVAAHAVSDTSVHRVKENFRLARLADPAEVLEESDLVLLAVPDEDLPGLVRGLAETGAPLAGRMLVHASGRYGVRVLDAATRNGALPLALHPMMTFAGREDDLDRIKGTCFGVTAPQSLRAVAEVLVIEMGGEPVFIPEESRPLYHAALTLAADHLIALVAEATALLERAAAGPQPGEPGGSGGLEGGHLDAALPVAGQLGGVPPGRLLRPLLAAALDNATRLGDRALTGPAARGDADTITADVAALVAASPGAAKAYLALARLSAGRALAAGQLRTADAERLLDILGDG